MNILDLTQLTLGASLALNAVGLALAGVFIQRKGGRQFLKSKLAARGLVRDRALEQFESAYQRTRLEQFAAFPPAPGAVVLLGDSQIEGGPWSELLGLAGLRNQGVSGDTVQGVTARLDALGPAGTVVLLVGINDINQGRAPDALLADYRQLLQALAARSPRPRVIVHAVLPIDPFRWGVAAQAKIVQFNPKLEALARELGMEWLDLYAAFCSDGKLDPAFSHDGLHLNIQGYLRWRDRLAPRLNQSGPSVEPL